MLVVTLPTQEPSKGRTTVEKEREKDRKKEKDGERVAQEWSFPF